MPRTHPVWGLNFVLGLTTITLSAIVILPGDGALATHTAMPWWVLAALIALAERWPVHLEFRRSAHSFSIADIPLVLGLVFATPAEMMLGVALGTSVALALRRLVPIKLVFNVLQYLLCAALGILIVRAFAGATDPEFGPLAWLGVAVALQFGGLLAIVLLCAAIILSDGAITREQVRQMFGVDAVVTLTNTSLALLLAVLLVERPAAVPIIGVPVAVVFIAYRSFASERQRREKLQFLYETNRTFLSAPEVAQAIHGLLARAVEAFRAEQAEIVLFGADEPEAVRVGISPMGPGAVLEPVTDAGVIALRDMADDAGRPVALRAPFPPEVEEYLTARGVQAGIVAALRGEERIVGFLMLANRFGLDRGFSDDDVQLIETLAANASAALQYDRLEQAVSELRTLQERLHHQAFHDGLTDLANRALFHQEVRAALHTDGGQEVAVLFLDLDDFKAVNDAFGHALGDELLAVSAERLRTCFEPRPGELVARLGGDEFAVLLHAPTAVDVRAGEVASAILESFREPVRASGRPFSVSVSVGIATSEHSGARAQDLLRDADVAMYEAKSSGKRRWSLFDPAMREAILRRHGLKNELEAAIDEGQLVVQFQPIVDLRTGQTAAVEALVRWQHPVHGLVPPDHFIPLAEETGLVVAVGRFVLREACRQAAEWQTAGAGGAPLAVHVNLSARELEDPAIIDSVAAALEESGIPPRQLVLELTETLLVQDAERGATTLGGLRALGVRLALDDFGTGFSSLSYLRTLPLDQLKIAREFIDGLGRDQDNHGFVRLIVELANTIGLEVVAEGVESAEQLAALRHLGCDFAQGFWFAPALDPASATKPLPRAVVTA